MRDYEPCACINVYESDDPPQLYQERTCRAKKRHLCSECGREVSPGEQIDLYWLQKDPGDSIKCFKTCSDCKSVVSLFFCDGYAFTRVWEDLEQHIYNLNGNIFKCRLDLLTEVSRDRVLGLVESYWRKTENV